MARDKRAPARAVAAPEKDPAYEGRRDNDRRSYHAWSFVENLAWPVAAIAIAFLAAITAVYVLHGQARVESFVNFLQGPAVLGLIGAVLAAAVKVVASVPHTARLERRQAEVQEGVAEATSAASASAARVDNIAKFVNRLDEKVDHIAERVDALVDKPTGAAADLAPITGVVRALAEAVARIEKRSQATQETVVGYGGTLQQIASSTGQLQARTAASEDAAREALWKPPSAAEPARVAPEVTPAPTRRPEPRWEPRRDFRPEPTPHPFDTRYPHHRDATAEQPAVAGPAGPADGGDEEEDWQDTGEGPGLDVSLVRGWREESARLAAEEEERRRLRPQPTPEPTPAWEPPPIRAAREVVEERERQEAAKALRAERIRRQSQWDNPEEGPR